MNPAVKNERPGSSLLQTLSAVWSWLFLAFLLMFFEIWSRIGLGQTFLFNLNSVQSILMASVQPLLLGLGLTFVIVAGGIDLSVGFIVGLASVIGARVMQELGNSVPPFLGLLIGIAAALVVSVIPGLINGLLIARLKVPPFIGTLGMYGIARGFGFLSANGVTVPVDNKVNSDFGNTNFLGIIPIPVLITIILIFLMHYVLSQTKFGQYTYAIGGNKQAAQRAGINVERHTVGLYMLTALMAGIAGVIYTARFTAGAAQAGEPTLLNAIAAVVIGGASLFGGAGTIIGTVIGALIIAVIDFGLVYINVSPFYQFIAVGMVIILSVLVDQSRRSVVGS